MQIFQQKAEIVRTEKLAEDICRFTIKAPAIAAASKPGQFVMLRTGEGLDPLLRRPFSVHQAAADGVLQVLFKIIGKGTQGLARLRDGGQIDVLGPLGRGFVHDGGHDHYLVGGGIGIAPLLFLAGRLLENNAPAAITVLLGARTKSEVAPLADEFAAIGLKVRTATEDGSQGQEGLVTDIMSGGKNKNPVMVYACGPYPMLRAVAGICRKQGWGCQVSLETIMACGLGACLGCAVSRADMNGYVHVCKEGPVFDADEVAWL